MIAVAIAFGLASAFAAVVITLALRLTLVTTRLVQREREIARFGRQLSRVLEADQGNAEQFRLAVKRLRERYERDVLGGG